MTFHLSSRVPALLCVTVMCACAGRIEEGRSLNSRSRTLGVVTTSDIESSGMSNALDALRRLRPELLTRRNDAVPADPYRGFPVVYLNGQLQGSLDMLEGIPAAAITEIRYLGSTAAADRFGVRHPGGVIAVSTRTP